jgi:hypothetical protein
MGPAFLFCGILAAGEQKGKSFSRPFASLTQAAKSFGVKIFFAPSRLRVRKRSVVDFAKTNP